MTSRVKRAVRNVCRHLRRFFETWTSGCELTRWAESPREAQAQARTLLRALE